MIKINQDGSIIYESINLMIPYLYLPSCIDTEYYFKFDEKINTGNAIVEYTKLCYEYKIPYIISLTMEDDYLIYDNKIFHKSVQILNDQIRNEINTLICDTNYKTFQIMTTLI